MDYTTLTIPSQSAPRLKPEESISLYQTLQKLTDPRRKQGKRYSLALILCLLVLAKLAGQKSLSGATEWVRHRAKTLAQQFAVSREEMPCQMTYGNVLAKIDAQELDELLSAFFTRWEAQARCGSEPSRLQTPGGHRDHAHVAIDGKTIRATRKADQPVHQLSAYDVATGIVLFQINVAEKQNEISALKPRLTPAFVKGRLFTLDALHTQTELCATIDRFGGFYVLVAKDNQPTLATDLADFFSAPPPDWCWQEAEAWEKAHGRLEYRRLIASPELNEWFANRWSGVAQVFRLERTTLLLKSGRVRQQVIAGISNLSMTQAPPARLLQLNRGHWLIENRLHWRRDVTLGEDSCQTRTGVVPSLLAQLNSTTLSLMDRLGVRNVARQARFLDAHPEQAVQLILTGQCRVV